MAEYYIQDKVTELNKRIDDAFTELDTQRNRCKTHSRNVFYMKFHFYEED